MNTTPSSLFYELVDKHLHGTINEAERNILADMLANTEYTSRLDIMMQQQLEERLFDVASDEKLGLEIRYAVQKRIKARPVQVPLRRLGWMRVAAMLIVIAGAASCLWYLLPSDRAVPPNEAPLATVNDRVPGTNSVILLLDDGTQVDVDSRHAGTIAREGGAVISKQEEGLLSYKASDAGTKVAYNTLKTPKGGKYQMVLSDGTKVWLNAASSIKYPTTFRGNDRLVSITGEVYLEVNADKSRPFKVLLNDGVEVHVLGTSFNVNAYEDEPVFKTTLLEGGISVGKNGVQKMLRPAQQAVWENNQVSTVKILDNADLQQVVAWKEGIFELRNTEWPTLMRQLSRWYDVEVVFHDSLPPVKLGGGISRKAGLQNVLQSLKGNGARFELKGNALHVYKGNEPPHYQ